MEASTTLQKTVNKDAVAIFELQKANQFAIGNTTVSQRKKKIRDLKNAVEKKYREAIHEAQYKDYRKSASEVDVMEIYPFVSDCKCILNNLGRWMEKKKVATPLTLMGTSSHVRHEPKGNVLIISPWNFPLLLSFGPLVSAIAAGNCVILKPSEITTHTSALMSEIISDVFSEDEVAVVEGGVPETTELLGLPFNHIFFTGSPGVGKIVMRAAAENLTSVTLELGGKSPTIVDKNVNLNAAAERIAWAKFINNGQVCIAPDYVLVHESNKDKLIQKIKAKIHSFYGEDPKSSPDYNRIVNNKHFQRVKSLMDDAIAKDATVDAGGITDDTENYISPTVISNIDKQSSIMEHEIFGPLLPVVTYKNLDEVVDYINSKERPLALYIYSSSRKNVNHILKNTRAGTSVINHSTVHYSNSHLPFGGVNNSGIGKAKGYRGFVEFSNERGVLVQHFFFSAVKLFMPPFTNFKKKLIDLAIKWL